MNQREGRWSVKKGKEKNCKCVRLEGSGFGARWSAKMARWQGEGSGSEGNGSEAAIDGEGVRSGRSGSRVLGWGWIDLGLKWTDR